MISRDSYYEISVRGIAMGVAMAERS